MMKTQITQKRHLLLGLLTVAFCITGSAFSAPPHPDLIERRQSEIALSLPLTPLPSNAEMHQQGICTPDDDFFVRYINGKQESRGANLSAAAAGFRILAILVQYSDKNSLVPSTSFDSLLFSSTGNTVRDYFDEISYGQIDLITVNNPSSLGWRTAPQTYAYYVNGQNATGSYPQNSQKMVEDLVDQVDPLVNFGDYDNDGDGFVDCLLIIHTGTGAEFSGNANDIWSHKWSITPRLKDGVRIRSFTVQPEYWNVPGDMTIGVYSHELCHGFGLPDLYDIDNSSYGIGKWCVMAVGSWNGPTGLGSSPSHPCAWSRAKMGIATPVNVTANLVSQSIANVGTGGTIYRMWTSGLLANEYFLVENRQQTGYDTHIPSSGLLIWHIDDSKTDNSQEWYPGQPVANHFAVALEQADGLFQLEQKTSYGNTADPFPGSDNKLNFNGTTTPNSNGYLSGATFVGVNNISSSGPTITADLIVGLASGIDDDQSLSGLPEKYELSQNYPNPFNPSTTIQFSISNPGQVSLVVYNTLGQEVATIFDGPAPSGITTTTWEAQDGKGSALASGVYFYKLVIDETEVVKKMVLLR
ncbi:MAG: M6 family metalloprotease domain-containing protein [candidate division Zixibacteria bacterium]|nr:M6 family metalloprotease domain-containing protein [candidate division Zixibacteria bacterium]